jgi:AcrR family transcriptional regulator
MARPMSEEARLKARTAALAVIAESGIAGFTVEAVAKRSGVAKTTIYRNWDTGNDLLIDAIDCMVTSFPTPDTGNLAGDLRDFLAEVMPLLDDPAMVRTMLGVMAAAADDPELDRIHQELMAERKAPLFQIIARARRRGEIRNDVSDDLALDLIEGPFMVRILMRRGPHDLDRLIDVICAGLAPAS